MAWISSMCGALGFVTATVAGVLVVQAPTASSAPCGVNLQALQIGWAAGKLRPPFDDMNVAWDPEPFDGNYDPCSPLSAALVSVQGATGSSPDQVMLFHFGDYVGTGTWDPIPFSRMNLDRTTPDTVAIDYKDGRFVCTACPGPINTVRYQWQGDHAEMLDPPPPA